MPMKSIEGRKIQLHPFSGHTSSKLELACEIGRCGEILQLAYTLKGDLKNVFIPSPAQVVERRDRLWESTCLECFIAEKTAEAYREFNLSPAGHWNVYRFDAYRLGMRQEAAFSTLPFNVRREPLSLYLSCSIDLQRLRLLQAELIFALAAVIKLTNGQTTYWAPIHPGPKPDFHHRDAFILEVGARAHFGDY